MRLDTSQQMRTETRLRMAPRMIQSMEILQLPVMALQERIEQELSENPVLEDQRESVSVEVDGEDSPSLAQSETEVDGESTDFETMMGLDENWSEIYDEGPRSQSCGTERGLGPQAGRHAEHGVATTIVPRRPDRPAPASSTAIRRFVLSRDTSFTTWMRRAIFGFPSRIPSET